MIAGTRTAGGILGESEEVNVQIEVSIEEITVEVIAVCDGGTQVAPIGTVNHPPLVVSRKCRTAQSHAPTTEEPEMFVEL